MTGSTVIHTERADRQKDRRTENRGTVTFPSGPGQQQAFSALKPLDPCMRISGLVISAWCLGVPGRDCSGVGWPKAHQTLGQTALSAITAAHCQNGRQEEMVSFHILVFT